MTEELKVEPMSYELDDDIKEYLNNKKVEPTPEEKEEEESLPINLLHRPSWQAGFQAGFEAGFASALKIKLEQAE